MAKSKKVNKWEAAPESIRKLKEAINGTVDGLSIAGELVDADEWEQDLIDILGKVLDDYNELEAKHNADCGLISKLEEENKAYETLAAELHNDTDELERTINDLEKMVEFHKGEVKELVKTADKVRDKHENEVRMLKKDVHDLEVKVKYYKEDIEDLECEASKYRALYEGLDKQDGKIADLESKLGSVTRERNHAEHILTELIEQLTSVSFDLCEVIEGYEKLKNENNNLKQSLLNILEMLETKVGLCRVRLLDSYENRANLIAVEHDKLLIKYEKLKEKNKTLISERDNLKSKNREWQVKCNNLQSVLNFRMHDSTPCGITNCPKVEMLTAERDGLNDYVEALKKRLNAIYGYRDTDNPCGICKNFDPKE